MTRVQAVSMYASAALAVLCCQVDVVHSGTCALCHESVNVVRVLRASARARA